MPTSSTSATAAIDVRALIQPDGGRERVADLPAAMAWCRALATSHYENFPVASILVPAPLRRHMSSIYAIARLGDDVGDEPWTTDPAERLKALAFLDAAVDRVIDTTGHPVFTALYATMDACGLPPSLFHRLFEAFRRDVDFRAPESWDDVLEYCHYSANPVGELVLHVAGGASPDAVRKSDAICTALQITNFIQDQQRDAMIGRRYLPVAVDDAIQRTRDLYRQGADVVRSIPSWRMRQEIRLIILAGSRMLERCQAMTDRLQQERPALGTSDYLRIIWRWAIGRRW